MHACAEKLEDKSEEFYKKLAERYTENKETFLAFAKESEENKVQVTRTYARARQRVT